MGSNGGEEIMVSGSHEPGSSEAKVEIKIKTLDSGTYTLSVDKRVPVPALKDQIATVTGVVSEQQRLICRGKVLKDDQLLSAYHVEDGHTLHMVVRQPIPPSLEGLPDHPASDATTNAGQSRGPSVFVETFNISELGDGGLPDLSRVISAVLSSFGITGNGSGIEGEIVEPPLETLSRLSGGSGASESGRQQTEQSVAGNRSNPLYALSAGHQTATLMDPLQAPVIPDSLTTLSHYISHLRNDFLANGVNGNVLPNVGTNGSNLENEPSQPVVGERSGLPGPATLAQVMRSTRQLLNEQVAECLSNLVRQLEGHGTVLDPSSRQSLQGNMFRAGSLLQNLGATLLELGRTTMMLRLGQTPADAVVNSGPAVFVSTSGPYPIMVQPTPFQLGTSFAAMPVGTAQLNAPPSGTHSAVPRNIDIRIRSGSLMPSVVNQREQTPSGQSPAPTIPAVVSGGPSSTRESEVRLRPVRTVVAAIPSIRHGRSDSTRNSVRLVLPVLARVQHVTSGNLSSVRSSQSSSEHSAGGVQTERQQIPDSDEHQRTTGLPVREGNNNLPSSGTQSNGGRLDMRGRLDQFLRSMLPGEQYHVSGLSSQSTADPASVHAETIEPTSNPQEAAPEVSDEGIFLSNVLRQIMPYISQMQTEATSSVRDTTIGQASSSRQDMDEDVNNSNQQADSDPSTSQSAKRQKRE